MKAGSFKMDINLSLVCLILVKYWACITDGLKITTERSLQIYAEVCGTQYLCHPPASIIHADPLVECPPCICEYSCYWKGNCCPDLHLGKCTDISILSENPSHQSLEGVYLIDDCTLNDDEITVGKCQSKNAILENVPVTDSITSITYRNKECAICNNVSSWESWNLMIECPGENIDLSVFSSIEDIKKTVSIFGCNFGYDPAELKASITPCGAKFISKSIRTCNVTGLWETFDAGIEQACLSSDNPFGFFRNIFCYICNSVDRAPSPLIASCLYRDDKLLVRLCAEKQINPRSYPFKNAHCRRCNLPHPSLLKSSEVYNKSETFPYKSIMSVTLNTTTLCGLRNSSPYRYLIYSSTMESICGTHDVLSDNSLRNTTELADFSAEYFSNSSRRELKPYHDMDFASLFNLYKTYGGRETWCFNNEHSDGPAKCLCHSDCGRERPCCPDALVNTLYECSDVRGDKTSLITKCPLDFEDSIIKYFCERSEEQFNTILDYIPVLYKTRNNMEFRNIFCVLCHMKTVLDLPMTLSIPENENPELIFRKIEVKCPSYLNVFDFMFLKETFVHLEKMCKIVFFHPSSALIFRVILWLPLEIIEKQIVLDTCDMTRYNVSPIARTCPQTSNPYPYQEEIQELCENTGNHIFSTCKSKYINIFCELCNLLANCTGANCLGFQNPQNAKDCEIAVTKFYEYEGISGSECLHCINYRHLFTVSHDMASSQLRFDKSCIDNQKYGQQVSSDSCREIVCSPGKHLANGSCVQFLGIATKLYYKLELSFRIEEILSKHPVFFQDILQALIQTISQSTEKIFAIQNGHVAAVRDCDTPIEFLERELFYANIVLKTKEEAFRDSVENFLFHHFTKYLLVNSTQLHANFSVSVTKRTTSYRMSQNICSLSFPNAATLSVEERSVNEGALGHLIVFSKFLFCPQFSFRHGEYERLGSYVIVKHGNSYSERMDFMFDLEGNVRVCIADFREVFYPQPKVWYILDIITTVAACVSVLCLTLSLVAYCLFSRLRSLPGKNIMLLQTMLLLSHLSMIVATFESHWSSRLVCRINGAFTHFFWLSMFCCTANCSFHMHNAFRRTLESRSYSSENSLFFRSLLFILGLPLIFVGTYILTSIVVLKEDPYGGAECFIGHKTILNAVFHAPIIVICVTNLIFYSLTACHLYNLPKTDSNREKTSYAIVSLKLYLITGITWLLQFVDGFFAFSMFSYVAALLNSCQGILICLVYTCNKNVVQSFLTCCDKSSTSELQSNRRQPISHLSAQRGSALRKLQSDPQTA